MQRKTIDISSFLNKHTNLKRSHVIGKGYYTACFRRLLCGGGWALWRHSKPMNGPAYNTPLLLLQSDADKATESLKSSERQEEPWQGYCSSNRTLGFELATFRSVVKHLNQPRDLKCSIGHRCACCDGIWEGRRTKQKMDMGVEDVQIMLQIFTQNARTISETTGSVISQCYR